METKIINFVNTLNKCWMNKNCDNLDDFFDENVVMTLPDLSRNITGKGTIVTSYKDFISKAHINSFDVNSVQTYSLENDNIAVYDFIISYIMNDKIYTETGRETLYIKEISGNLKVYWRGLTYF